MSAFRSPADEWDDFRMVTGRLNKITGQMIDIDPPLPLHCEDRDWFERMWLLTDEIDYEIMLARVRQQAGAAA